MNRNTNGHHAQTGPRPTVRTISDPSESPDGAPAGERHGGTDTVFGDDARERGAARFAALADRLGVAPETLTRDPAVDPWGAAGAESACRFVLGCRPGQREALSWTRRQRRAGAPGVADGLRRIARRLAAEARRARTR